MLVRILQFVIGAMLAGGGGYLAWTHRTAGMNVFPPEAGMPWLVIAGVLGLCAGVVFLVSAVHPRPNTRALAEARAKRRDETLGAAEAYYSSKEARRDRAADSDWRSGDIAPPAAPVPPPAPEPVKMVEPVRVATPVAPVPAPEKVVEKAPEKPPEKPKVVEAVVAPVAPVAAPAPVTPVVAPSPAPAPVAAPAPAPVQTLTPAPAAKPVATSAPPEPMMPPLFPSTATLAPIPAASEPPPAAPLEKPAEKPVGVEKPAAATTAPANAFGAIRTAIAAGKLDEAEKLLNAGRETAQGLELAELTGLAGDHAAAAGRLSNAKWLWRLSLKRFGELSAMDTPAAQAVAESLRVAG